MVSEVALEEELRKEFLCIVGSSSILQMKTWVNTGW